MSSNLDMSGQVLLILCPCECCESNIWKKCLKDFYIGTYIWHIDNSYKRYLADDAMRRISIVDIIFSQLISDFLVIL